MTVNFLGTTELQKEFTEVLHDPTSMHNKSEAARLPQNKSKNRFENILPYDHTRVKLCKNNTFTSDGNDYINANYCSSMRRQRNYIITQNPMECTLFDFWCMVWENTSLTIVMLSYQEEVRLFLRSRLISTNEKLSSFLIYILINLLAKDALWCSNPYIACMRFYCYTFIKSEVCEL